MEKINCKQVETIIVELYYQSLNPSNPEYERANMIIDKYLEHLTTLSIYLGYDHVTAVKKLYFSKQNIKSTNIMSVARSMFIDERTLYDHRKKYCLVFNHILTLFEDNEKEEH